MCSPAGSAANAGVIPTSSGTGRPAVDTLNNTSVRGAVTALTTGYELLSTIGPVQNVTVRQGYTRQIPRDPCNMAPTIPGYLATGGSGTAYEQRVGAMFLSCLITRNPSPVFPDCPVEAVGFQTGPTATGERTTSSSSALRAACNVKSRSRPNANSHSGSTRTAQGCSSGSGRTLTPGADSIPARMPSRSPRRSTPPTWTVLPSCWTAPGIRPTPRTSKTGWKPPLWCERGPPTTMRQSGISWRMQRAAHDVSDEKIWRFLRSLRILFLDFDRQSSQSMMNVMDMLSRSADGAGATDTAKATWNALVSAAASYASGAPNHPVPRPAREAAGEAHTQLRTITDTIPPHKNHAGYHPYHHRGNGDPAACRDGRQNYGGPCGGPGGSADGAGGIWQVGPGQTSARARIGGSPVPVVQGRGVCACAPGSGATRFDLSRLA